MNGVYVKTETPSDVEHEEDRSFTSGDTAIVSGKPSLFTCPECSQSFKTKSSLHYHQRKYRHCGMEPFACGLCGKEFGIATHLTSHMRTHTKQRPFFCPLEDCDRVYSRIDLVNVHLIKCHKINYKVKSKCFRDGVFCGQVFINGEMRTIQKVIPDKSAADGIEIEMPHGLAAKMHGNSHEASPLSKSFDDVDGLARKTVVADVPVPPISVSNSRHGGGSIDPHVPALNNVPYPILGQKIISSHLPVHYNVNHNSVNGGYLKQERLDSTHSQISEQLNSAQLQDAMNNFFFPEIPNASDLLKQMQTVCTYVNPSLQKSAEVRFGNTNGGSVTSSGLISGLTANKPQEMWPKSGGLHVENVNNVSYPSNGRVESNGGPVSPLLGTEFPKLLSESNQPREKKRKTSAKGPIRRPIEIPKLKVKVCIIPNESRYKCPDCDYITDTMQMAILHMRESQHGGMKRKTYRCQMCSKKFLLKETVCRHMKTCNGHSNNVQKHSTFFSVPVKSVKYDVLSASKDNKIAPPLKTSGFSEIRKEVKTEPVDNNSLIAQPKCAIDLNSYSKLATFGDVSNFAHFKNENVNTSVMPPLKKKKLSNMEEEKLEIKKEPGVAVKLEKTEQANKLPALPGIGTFFSSNLSSSNMFGQTPSLPPFQSFLGMSTKNPGSFNLQDVEDNTMNRAMVETGKPEKSLSSLFPWLDIKSVLKSFPSDLNLTRCSESDPADVAPGKGDEQAILDVALTGNQGNSHTCSQCRATFKTLSLLRYHQHKNSHDGYKPYPCTHCDSSFGSKGHLETHLRKHTKEKPYFCPLCHRTFSRVDLVNSHLRLQHNMPIHISGKDVLLPKYMWNSEEENSIHMDDN